MSVAAHILAGAGASHAKIDKINFDLFIFGIVYQYILCQIYGNYGIVCFVNYDDIMLIKLRAVAGHRNSLLLLFL